MTTWQVVRWWEIRRIPYNVILFVIGIASIFAMEWFVDKVAPVGGDAPALATGLTVVLYGILANLGYTLGWIVELVIRQRDESQARAMGKRFFALGMWLSCLLTTAPFWLGFVFWLLHKKG